MTELPPSPTPPEPEEETTEGRRPSINWRVLAGRSATSSVFSLATANRLWTT